MSKNLIPVICHSLELDTELAAKELIQQARVQLEQVQPQAGILYLGIDYEHQTMVDEIMAEWPHLQLVGCSTDGELSSLLGYEEDSAVLLLLGSNTCQMVSGYVDNRAKDLKNVTENALQEAIHQMGDTPKLCILLSDVLRINGELIMQAITEVTDQVFPVFGGISADRWQFEETHQICNHYVSSDISPFLLISGPFDFSWGMNSGWEPFGEMGTITKAASNVVYEIDNQPAIAFYQKILGDAAKPTLELPIAIHDAEGQYKYLRTSFENSTLENGAVTYLGNIPEQSKVRITMVSRESILSGVSSALTTAMERFPQDNNPALVLCFSCSARRVLLGTRTKEEYLLTREAIGSDIPLVGFYTYGEFCPNDQNTEGMFHNETFVVVLLG